MSSASLTSSFFSGDGADGAEGLVVELDPKKEANVLVAPEADAETVGAGLGAPNVEPEDGVAPKGDDDEGAAKVKDPDPDPPENELELEVVDPNPPNPPNLGTEGTGGICRTIRSQN